MNLWQEAHRLDPANPFEPGVLGGLQGVPVWHQARARTAPPHSRAQARDKLHAASCTRRETPRRQHQRQPHAGQRGQSGHYRHRRPARMSLHRKSMNQLIAPIHHGKTRLLLCPIAPGRRQCLSVFGRGKPACTICPLLGASDVARFHIGDHNRLHRSRRRVQ